MLLNSGNIKKKSRILKSHFFDTGIPGEISDQIYNDYCADLDNIPGIENYRLISKDLHDSLISIRLSADDVILALELYNDFAGSYKKTLIFKDARIISYNKILKSGKISRINRKIEPYEYLYDELYYDDNYCYITIIVTTKKRVKVEVYFPILTIRFKKIDIDNL